MHHTSTRAQFNFRFVFNESYFFNVKMFSMGFAVSYVSSKNYLPSISLYIYDYHPIKEQQHVLFLACSS